MDDDWGNRLEAWRNELHQLQRERFKACFKSGKSLEKLRRLRCEVAALELEAKQDVDAAAVAEGIVVNGPITVHIGDFGDAALRLLASHARDSATDDDLSAALDAAHAYHDATMNEMHRAALAAGASSEDGRAVAITKIIGELHERAKRLDAELDAWRRLAIARETLFSTTMIGRRMTPEERREQREAEAAMRALGIDPATGERIEDP